MAIRTVITRGYGNGTFNGTIPLVTLRGYISNAIVGFITVTATTSAGGITATLGNPNATATATIPSITSTIQQPDITETPTQPDITETGQGE